MSENSETPVLDKMTANRRAKAEDLAFALVDSLYEVIEEANGTGDLAIWSDSISYFDDQVVAIRDLMGIQPKEEG